MVSRFPENKREAQGSYELSTSATLLYNANTNPGKLKPGADWKKIITLLRANQIQHKISFLPAECVLRFVSKH